MAAITSARYGVERDWILGEDAWKDGMDRTLLLVSALLTTPVVVSRTTVSLPAAAGLGAMYIVDSGDATYPNQIAVDDALDTGNAWTHFPPEIGAEAVVADEGYGAGLRVIWNGTAWLPFIPKAPEYAKASLPSAATFRSGMICVTDDVGGYTLAFSDGTNWRRVADRAVVA